MYLSSNSACLFLLLLSRALDRVQGRPLCSPIEVALLQRADGIYAGPIKFAPGYLVGVTAAGDKISNSQELIGRGVSGVPGGKICTATGSPVGEERGGALEEALLGECGISVPGGDVHNTIADGLCIQDHSGAVSTPCSCVYLLRVGIRKTLMLLVGVH